MLHVLRRHPLPMAARLERSLVLVHAFPAGCLEPLLPPGLTLERHGRVGFVAIALVRARRLRPAFLPPWLGFDVFMSGYRVFTRLAVGERRLRGLKILRSDMDHWLVRLAARFLTHYGFRPVRARQSEQGDRLSLEVVSPDGSSDLRVTVRPGPDPPLPVGSPLADWREARKYEGPLPFTFDYEPETRSLILVEGVRARWEPIPVEVVELRSAFLDELSRRVGAAAVLSHAFLVEGVDYRWKAGRRVAVPAEVTAEAARGVSP